MFLNSARFSIFNGEEFGAMARIITTILRNYTHVNPFDLVYYMARRLELGVSCESTEKGIFSTVS